MDGITGFHHVAFTVSDADASAGWYARVLGLEEVLRGDDDTVSFRVLAGHGLVLGVRQYHGRGDEGFSEFRIGLDHAAIGVGSRADLEAWEQRLTEIGVAYTPITETPIGTVVVFRDPDGIQLELWLPVGT